MVNSCKQMQDAQYAIDLKAQMAEFQTAMEQMLQRIIM